MTLDALSDEDGNGVPVQGAEPLGSAVSRESGAWLNPLNTPTPRDRERERARPVAIEGQSDTLAKMGAILNSLASGANSGGGLPRSNADPLKLAQAREADKRRKASLSYKLRKQLFSPKFLRTYFILALAAQVTAIHLSTCGRPS